MSVQLDHKLRANPTLPVSTLLDPQIKRFAEAVAKKAFKFFSGIPFDQIAYFTCQFSNSHYSDNISKIYAITLRKGPEQAKAVNHLSLTLNPEVTMGDVECTLKNLAIGGFSVDCNIPLFLIGIEQEIVAKLDPLLEEHAHVKLMKFLISQHEDFISS
jgi:hypothetical protein